MQKRTNSSFDPSPGGARRRLTRSLLLCAVTALLAVPIAGLDGPHDHHTGRSHEITTDSPEAQRLFDHGLGLAFGFNHLEASRAFRKAAEQDPECAMCWWGLALTLGPNINAPLDPQYYPQILEALDNARRHAPRATAKEQAYIRALGERYGPEPVEDRSELDHAYARAMRRVANAYPDDLDAATLFAEAVMDTTPWDYWKPNSKPKPETKEFLDVLESVLRRDATNPGANHLLIHAVEKTRPDLGVSAAERLEGDPQATGHLVHMASHIYIRVGRYDDAARVNEMAIADDDAYAATHEVPNEYIGYMLHNHHMRWAALLLGDRGDEAAQEAEYLAEQVDDELMQMPVFAGFFQHLDMLPILNDVAVGKWDAVLAAPEPAAELLYPRALWHFARGVADVRKERVEQAAGELESLRRIAADPAIEEVSMNFNAASVLLKIAENTLAGEIAAAGGDGKLAVRHLSEAVRIEDGLTYDEPPPWLPPVRQWMGQALLEVGRPAQAEKSFREDLEMYPGNRKSTEGLRRSLEAQGKDADARSVAKDARPSGYDPASG